MIIFLSQFRPLLNRAFYLEAAGGSIENWLEPKTEPPSVNLACTNPWNALKTISNPAWLKICPLLRKLTLFRIQMKQNSVYNSLSLLSFLFKQRETRQSKHRVIRNSHPTGKWIDWFHLYNYFELSHKVRVTLNVFGHNVAINRYSSTKISFHCVNWKCLFLDNSFPQMSMDTRICIENQHWCL